MYMHVKTNDFEAEEDGREKIKVIFVPFAASSFSYFGQNDGLREG